jgi:hypothetical protein
MMTGCHFFIIEIFRTHAKMKKVGKSLLGNILYFLFLYFWRKTKKIFFKFSTSVYSLLMKLFNFTKWKNFIKIHTKEKFNFRFKKMSIYGKRHISFLNPALQCCKRHKFRVFIKAVFFFKKFLSTLVPEISIHCCENKIYFEMIWGLWWW